MFIEGQGASTAVFTKIKASRNWKLKINFEKYNS